MKDSKLFKYGMRLRGFAPMCQPMNGFVEREDDGSGKYYDILVYNRELTNKELTDYELDNLNLELERNLSVTLKVNHNNITLLIMDNESGDTFNRCYDKSDYLYFSTLLGDASNEIAGWLELMEDELNEGR